MVCSLASSSMLLAPSAQECHLLCCSDVFRILRSNCRHRELAAQLISSSITLYAETVMKDEDGNYRKGPALQPPTSARWICQMDRPDFIGMVLHKSLHGLSNQVNGVLVMSMLCRHKICCAGMSTK
jgi:hypothetical protein